MRIRNLCNAFIRHLRAYGIFIFDTVVLWRCSKPPRREAGAIFCLHGLGDLLLSGHAVDSLVSHLHGDGLQATLFVHPDWVTFAREHFRADVVEEIHRHRFTRNLGYRRTVLKSISGRFTRAYQPTYNRMFRVEDALVRATGAALRIGCAGHAPFITPQERRLGDRIYTTLVEPSLRPLHELERYAEFMAAIGLSSPLLPWRTGPVPLHPSLPSGNFIVLAPEASDRRRSWPLENFLRVAEAIAHQHSLCVVIVRRHNDDTPFRWPGGSAPRSGVVDLSGKITTVALPAVLAGARLVLCNDSGFFHLAIALGRPVVAVGGSGLPVRYFPYPQTPGLAAEILFREVPCGGCNWRCIHPITRQDPAPCLAMITWQEMLAASERVLQTTAQPA